LGALRSAAQMISYEVSFGLILLALLGFVESLNLNNIIQFQESYWFILGVWLSFLLFFISILAETNRPPFDLPEAEAELVAGYNVEYAALTFALFFLAEYSNMILMGAFGSILFFGGGSFFSFTLKILFFLFLFV
jgi:NADH:ubiquinone oxidoreductase subunit H